MSKKIGELFKLLFQENFRIKTSAKTKSEKVARSLLTERNEPVIKYALKAGIEKG